MIIPTFKDLMIWKESIATCAIEGNPYAIEQLGLWETDRRAFIKEYIRQEGKEE